jgi:hypothetical protein
MSISLILALIAAVLAAVVLVNKRGNSLLAWAILALAAIFIIPGVGG